MCLEICLNRDANYAGGGRERAPEGVLTFPIRLGGSQSCRSGRSRPGFYSHDTPVSSLPVIAAFRNYATGDSCAFPLALSKKNTNRPRIDDWRTPRAMIQ